MKEKLLFVCLTCQMTDAIHIEGTETVKEVIALMASEHKKSMPRCKSEGKYRLVLKDGEAQQNVQRTAATPRKSMVKSKAGKAVKAAAR